MDWLWLVPRRFGQRLVCFGREPVEHDMLVTLVHYATRVRNLDEELRRIKQSWSADTLFRGRTIDSTWDALVQWDNQLSAQIKRCKHAQIPNWKIRLACR